MLALVAVVVGVDVLFFGHRFWERLMVNVGIVLVFAAFYWSLHFYLHRANLVSKCFVSQAAEYLYHEITGHRRPGNEPAASADA